MALPLLNYPSAVQNSRIDGYEVQGDDQPRIYNAETLLGYSEMEELIDAAYRQIFFHAFKSDRDSFLESQLQNNQITVRDFIRGLLLSDTFLGTFYAKNSNYRFVEQCIQRVLGRDPYNEREKLAWSIKVASQGPAGFIDELLDSEEYLENFGYDIVPYQRRRSLPGRATGETPFNIKSPRYDEYYRTILGFPKSNISWQQQVRSYVSQDKKPKAGDPALYMDMAKGLNLRPTITNGVNTANISMSSVPYRKLNVSIGPSGQ